MKAKVKRQKAKEGDEGHGVTHLLFCLLPFYFRLPLVALQSRHKKSSHAPVRLVGRAASVERALNPEGFVMVDGELWRARLRAGGRVGRDESVVRVVGASGCVLEVELIS